MQLIRSPSSRRVWVVLALSIALIAAMAWLLTQSLSTLNEGSRWVAHSERVRYQLVKTLQTLSDLGNGISSYQLTHDARLFEPAENATRSLQSELHELGELTAWDGAQAPLLQRLQALAAQRERETRDLREMALSGDVASVQTSIAGGAARRMMDAARGVIGQMQLEEQHQLDVHAAEARAAYQSVQAGIWSAAVIAIALLFALRHIMVRDARRLGLMQEELATTLRSVGDAVIATNDKGEVRFINTVAEQLTGWDNERARGRPLHEVFQVFNEQTHEPVPSPVERVLRENAVVGLANHTVLRSRDGTERPVEDSGAPIRGADGTVTGVVLVFRDATDERAARRALMASRDALSEADRRKDIFLATLSHELRNPLAPIRTAARVLELPNVAPEDVERSRAVIARQVRQMSALLDDLLDISRITRGVLTLKREPANLAGLVRIAIETAQPLIEAKAHTLTVNWPPGDLRVVVDPVRLTQVIANLLTNAAKYTRPQGQINLSVEAADGQVRICVRDTGIGIASEMLPRVFEMFAQIDSSQEHAEGGIGIGLALVKGFVELHGGRVTAASDGLQAGSVFTVHLPAAMETAAASAAAAQPAETAPRQRRKVLVADDNRDGAEVLGILIEEYGYDVQLAFDGSEALALAARMVPDIAILDIGMPGLTGYQVAQQIRTSPWGTQMRLIALTGWGQDDDRRRALDAGFNRHLIKPVDPDALEAALKSESAA